MNIWTHTPSVSATSQEPSNIRSVKKKKNKKTYNTQGPHIDATSLNGLAGHAQLCVRGLDGFGDSGFKIFQQSRSELAVLREFSLPANHCKCRVNYRTCG
jgi:hypothetical protein